MKLQSLSIALFIFFISLTVFVFREIKINEEEKQPEKINRTERPIYEYLIGENVQARLDRDIKEGEHKLPNDFWDALRYMDQLIIDEELAKAYQLRKRLQFMSEFIEKSLGRSGFLSLVASHADLVDEKNQNVVLDADVERARRRHFASEGLAALWRGDFEEAYSCYKQFPSLHSHNLQTVETAFILRIFWLTLSQNHGIIPEETVKKMESLLVFNKDHPAALVQSQRAILLEEMAISGLIQGQSDELCQEILTASIEALQGQSPNRIELLDLVMRVSLWDKENSANARYFACDYLEVLDEQISGHLFRKAYEHLLLLGKDEKAQSWIEKHLSPESHLYPAALHIQALKMQQAGTVKEVFETFQSALDVTSDPKDRASLLVDLGVFEKDLSKDQSDKNRTYLKRAMVRFQEAVKLDPENISAKLNLATVSLRVGRVDFARQWLQDLDFRRASRRNTAIAHFNWGKIYIAENNKEKAQHHYDLAKSCDPDLPGLVSLYNDLQ